MKSKLISKLISGMLIAACVITSLTNVPIQKAKAAETNLKLGEIYHYVDQDWMVTEIHDHHAVLQSLTGTNYNWIGTDAFPTNYYYGVWCGHDIYGMEAWKQTYYNSLRGSAYEAICKYEYKDAANDGGCKGKGLYMSEKLGRHGIKENGKIKQFELDMSNPWDQALELIRENGSYKKVWLGEYATNWYRDVPHSKSGALISIGCFAFLYEKDSEGHSIIRGADIREGNSEYATSAPAFNIDTSKVIATQDHRIIGRDTEEGIKLTRGQTDVCIISNISDKELDPDQLQVSVPQKLLFASRNNSDELIGAYSANNKLKNDGVNKVQFTSAKLNTEDGWEFVSDATKESADNKVDFTITAERGDKIITATTMTATEMVNKKDLSADENYKLNSKNKTNGSNYTELTSSGHVSGFSGDVSTETKIGDIAWKVKVTH